MRVSTKWARSIVLGAVVLSLGLAAMPVAASGGPEASESGDPKAAGQGADARLGYVDSFSMDPLGLFGWPWHRQYSLGTDRWEVFLCKPSAGGLSLDTLMTQIGQSGIAEHFSWWSGGRYTITFTAGAEIITEDPGDCDWQVYEQLTSGTFNGAIMAHTYTGPYDFSAAAIGQDCPEGTGLCPAARLLFPENWRTAWMQASAFVDNRGVALHELGHALSWPHSFTSVTLGGTGCELFWRYDNPADIESVASTAMRGTHAVNRYAAGWIDPDRVFVFGGETATIWLAAHGTAGYEMIAIREGQLGVFFSLDARVLDAQYDPEIPNPYDPVPPTLGDWTGIEVYRVDQRRDVCEYIDLPETDLHSNLPCYGPLIELQPVTVHTSLTYHTQLQPADYMLHAGDSMIVGSALVEVLRREGNRFRVRLSPHEAVTCQGLAATIVGTPGADILTGTRRSDIIAGLGGDDIIDGRGGNDIICGDSGRDRIYGGPGQDRLIGGAGSDRIYGQGGSDTIDGGPGGDRLFGGDLGDRLWGTAGNDRLVGGAGPDKMSGGLGTDVLIGGPGEDMCYGGDCELDFLVGH